MAQDLLENQFKTQWVQLRGSVRDKWLNLTQEDVQQINGNYDLLVSKLQQRYGYSQEEAENRIQSWIREKGARNPSSERAYEYSAKDESTYREKDRENPSLLKWVFAIGIPLFLLASYFASQSAQPMEDAPVNTVNTPMVASDQLVSESVLSAFRSNSALAPMASNIRVSTNNGIVTLSGTVNTAQERELAFNTARNVTGVRQVNNQIEIR